MIIFQKRICRWKHWKLWYCLILKALRYDFKKDYHIHGPLYIIFAYLRFSQQNLRNVITYSGLPCSSVCMDSRFAGQNEKTNPESKHNVADTLSVFEIQPDSKHNHTDHLSVLEIQPESKHSHTDALSVFEIQPESKHKLMIPMLSRFLKSSLNPNIIIPMLSRFFTKKFKL